jgi:hypothetical protein
MAAQIIPRYRATSTGWFASAIPLPTDRKPEASAFLTARMIPSNDLELRVVLAATTASERQTQTDNEVF